ncbi:MAG: beta-ketoacyl-ACP synthase [Alphaproteobacteria bacterium]
MTKEYTDKKGRPIVAITGSGVISSLGRGKAENWANLTAGRSGIRQISRFPTEGLRTTIAGAVDFVSVEPNNGAQLVMSLAEIAATEALEQAGLAGAQRFPGPLCLATPPAELEWPLRRELFAACDDATLTGYQRLLAAARTGKFQDQFHFFQFASVAEFLADRFGTRGLPVSISTACASGATAIQSGVEAIRRGETDTALCIGTDASVQLEALIRFSLLSAISPQNDPPEKASKPFSKNRDGFIMAEGAGALVLESLASARARGAEVLGLVRGCGEKADDYHRTRSRPDGTAIIGAIRNAMEDADAAPEEIGYINAHGTSTPENDKMEYVSLKAVLGDHLDTTPISSNKSMIGHTLSAAGAIEAVFSLMTMQTGMLPPTINYDMPDPDIPLDVVPNVAREAKAPIKAVLSNSFGFGGQNACLVLGAA